MAKHSIKNIVRAVTENPWFITADKLQTIGELLDERADGKQFSAEEIRARIGDRDDEDDRGYYLDQGVAVIPLFGVIAPKANLMTEFSGGASLEIFQQQLAKALADPLAKAIVLDVDSPGGNVLGVAAAAEAVFEARQKKPLVAVANGQCASAAYYIASAAERVVATLDSTVGSIGVLTLHRETSRFDEGRGIKTTVIAAGKHKVDGNPYEPLSAQGKATLQERVNDYYDQFVAAVAKHRGVDVGDVRGGFGQGKAILAARALDAGMIDAIDSLTNVIANLARNTNSKPVPAMGRPAATDIQPGPSGAGASTKDRVMTTKIKSALFACDMIDDRDADDATCNTAVKAFYRARGEKLPTGEGADDKILAALASSFSGAAPTSGPANSPQAGDGSGSGDGSSEADKAAIRAQERERINDIRSSAELFAQAGLAVDDKLANEAVEKGWSHEEFVKRAKKAGAASEKPVQGASVQVTADAVDKFTDAAVDALMFQAGVWPEKKELTPAATALKQAGLSHIAHETLRLAGKPPRAFATKETIALEFLQLGGAGASVFASDGGSYNRPGDFPNLLSNLAGKMMDQALELADVSYPLWTGKLPDISDFKPKTILQVGHFDELDLINDDDEAKQLKLAEELSGWIQIDRFGNSFGLTPVMVANDDLDAFTEGLKSLAVAHEYTLNRLCVGLVTGNVTLLDGYALFDNTNHINDIAAASGGPPSVGEVSKMREKHRAQPGVGGKGKVKTPPKIALVPTLLETEAEQVLLPNTLYPATDATINVFRGKVIPVVEPELDANSTKKWYTFADPKIRRVIVHAFQTGYGRMGRRTTWFEPSRETRYYKLEGRFAAAVAGYRGAVRNAGE